MKFFMKLLSIFLGLIFCWYMPAYAGEYFELGKFKYVRDNLYENGVDLYFLTEIPVKGYDGESRSAPLFLKRFSYEDSDKEVLDPFLKDVIDRKSWRRVSKFFYRDADKSYCFHPSSNGGYLIFMDEIHPDTHKFYGGSGWQPVEAFDLVKRSASSNFITDNFEAISWYSTNGEDVFYRCTKIEGADVDTFKVVKNKDIEWTAKDNNRFYDGSRVFYPHEKPEQ